MGVLTLLLLCAGSSSALARDIDVTPASLDAALSGLAPGDRVLLASGTYDHFTLSGIAGTAAMPIAIEAAAGATPIIAADSGPCCNTIQIDGDVSYVVLRGLTIDGRGIDGAFGIDARGPNVHHVTVEGCTFVGHDASQQTVAISTKTATSGWVIRGNVIMGAGTGMYLGNSDGSDPFVGGLIEGNAFYDPRARA
jgi:nitrous oxidase accessory protein NosD